MAGITYHHPSGSSKQFIDALDASLSKLTSNNCTFYLLGDFNINIDPNARNESAKNFIDSLLSNHAFLLITLSTRVANHLRTIIDNITTNDSQIILRGVTQTDLSDNC